MKSTFRVAVLLLAVCTVLFSGGAWAKPDNRRAVPITRDNFVALEYESPSGSTSFKRQILVRGNMFFIEGLPTLTSLALFSGSGEDARPPAAWLSNNQLDELLRLINRTRLPLLAGNYDDPKANGAVEEVLTLKYSDNGNHDRSVVIRNQGKTAPRAFFQVVELLELLRKEKYAVTTTATEALFTRDSLQQVTFESIGGFAGIQSTIEVKFPEPKVNAAVSIEWMYTVNKRGLARNADLQAEEADELLRLLNAGNLPKLNGQRYRQPGLFDGFNETLTVTQRDGKKYVVENYGDQAPSGYTSIAAYLRQLQQKHFPQE